MGSETLPSAPDPKNVFEVRSFLGLDSYYRCFIKDFASIATPVSDILKGENGTVSRYRSKNLQVQFNEQQRLPRMSSSGTPIIKRRSI